MKRFVPLVAAMMLAGCGLQPMYAGGGNGVVARGLSGVEVAAIKGKDGWLVRNALVDQMGNGHSNAPARYRLDVRLDDKLEGYALMSDDTISRERRTLRARYQLVEISSGKVLLDATASSDSGIDVVSSDYATIAAEQTALENLSKDIANRIVTTVALRLRGDTSQ